MRNAIAFAACSERRKHASRPPAVNGDGAPDIIASDNNQLVWFENPLGHGGNPATDPWPVHVIRAGGGTHVIALGDIDGDGKTDIICSSSGLLGSSGAILFQNTPDSWTELRFGTVGESVALLDIGSGMGRINIAGGDGKSVVWYENPRESGGNARTGAWIRLSTRPHGKIMERFSRDRCFRLGAVG